MLWTDGQDGLIVFSLNIFISKKLVRNMKPAFTNVLFRHNSACAIQKWLKFKSHHIQISISLIKGA